MTREVILGDGAARLILGDCREVLPTLGRVEAVIWDPPWGIDFGEYSKHKDKSSEYAEWMAERLPLAEGLLVDGWFVVFQGPRRAHEWSTLVPRPWRVMACAKNFTQILPGLGPVWSTDFALFWPVGKPEATARSGRDFHIANTTDFSTRPKGHPCPRPLDQMHHLVSCFSTEGTTVLDPTMGSGTTGVAAVQLGRRFVGIEIDEQYFDIACRRIADALSRPRLPLDEPPPQPVQGAFL